jgi:hypothetical protein
MSSTAVSEKFKVKDLSLTTPNSRKKQHRLFAGNLFLENLLQAMLRKVPLSWQLFPMMLGGEKVQDINNYSVTHVLELLKPEEILLEVPILGFPVSLMQGVKS